LLLSVPYKNYCCHAAVAQGFLSLSEGHQERVSLNGAGGVGEGLDVAGLPIFFCLLILLFASEELLLGEDFTLSVLTDGDELSGQLYIFQIEELILLHPAVEVLLVGFVMLERIVKHFVFVVVVHLFLF